MGVKIGERPYEIEVVVGQRYYRLLQGDDDIMHSKTHLNDAHARHEARKVCKKNRFRYTEADPSLDGVDFLEDEPVKTKHLDKEKK